MTGTASETAAPARPVQAAPRAQVYRLLAEAFRYPARDFVDELASGAWPRALASALSALPFEHAAAEFTAALPELDAVQVEYTRLFDVGEHGPPCPLNEGHYGRDRLRVMEEVVRFFEYFGLRFCPESGLLPDHLSVELEFMEALAGGAARTDPGSGLRAQLDFLQRHLCSWLPAVDQAVSHYAELELYPALTGLASAFIEADHAYLTAMLRSQERPA